MSKVDKKIIRDELWRRGELTWKMHSIQKEMFKLYEEAGPRSTQVWLLSRQTGKSYGLAMIAIIEAIRKPNSIIKLLTDTKLHVRTIFEPIFREILEDCPEDVKPEYLKSDFIYQFPNGSQIQMAGTDAGNAERLRGQKSTLILVDEAGFCTNLNYNVLSILLPTTTHTKGKLILASTPPEEPDHEFIGFIEQAELEGNLTKKTLWDNPILSEEDKMSILARFPGGRNNPQFKREYECEIIRNESKTVIPEFDDKLQEQIVQEYIKPPHFTPYVSMDIGFKDLTFVLFGYYDFKANKLIIEEEIVKKGKELHLPNLSKEIYETEQRLWTNYYTNEFIEPENRVSDIDYIVIQEINRASQGLINFTAVTKETGYKLPLINRLRVMLQSGQIVISPKCVNLIRHLKNARWKDSNTKSEFARSPDDGHYDGVDALLYLVKSVNFNKNPYPKGYSYNSQDMHINKSSTYDKNHLSDVYHSIFGRKKSR